MDSVSSISRWLGLDLLVVSNVCRSPILAVHQLRWRDSGAVQTRLEQEQSHTTEVAEDGQQRERRLCTKASKYVLTGPAAQLSLLKNTLNHSSHFIKTRSRDSFQ